MTETVGSDSTVTPSTAVAALALPSELLSAVLTALVVVVDGTLMVAVILTLAAATAMLTSEALTPATEAMAAARAEVSA